MHTGGPRRHRYSAGDRVLAIVNPNTRADVMSIRAALGQWVPDDVQLVIHETRANIPTEVDTRRLLKEWDVQGVIAAGGDGTVSEVAAALQGVDIPLSIIPAGSTNIIAREMGIPTSISAAAALAFGPFALRHMDVGTCNDKPFLHMAGTGIDSKIFDNTDDALKRRIGWLAYLPPAMKAMRESSSQVLKITIEDEPHTVTASLALVANGSSIINPKFRLDGAIRSDDGYLDLLVLTATRPHEIALAIAQAAAGSMSDSPYVMQRKVKRVRIETTPPMPVQLDGDVATMTPATFGVLSQAISVAVPTRRERTNP